MKASDFIMPPAPEHGDSWGDWRLNMEKPPSLDFHGGCYQHHPYQVVLTEVSTWLGFCRWLHHLSGKTWARGKGLGDFFQAVMDVQNLGYPGGRI
jgi:hypothetical protein